LLQLRFAALLACSVPLAARVHPAASPSGARRARAARECAAVDIRARAAAGAQSLERPDAEEAEATAKETQAAFDRIVANRISAAQPKTLPAQPGAPTYIKYTPAQQVARAPSQPPVLSARLQLPVLSAQAGATCRHVRRLHLLD